MKKNVLILRKFMLTEILKRGLMVSATFKCLDKKA